MNRHLWVRPLVLLVILLLLFAFRWDTVSTKTTSNQFILWKTDRWANTTWKIIYYVNSPQNSVTETPVNIPYTPPDKPSIRQEDYKLAYQEYEINGREYISNVQKYINNKKTTRQSLTIAWVMATLFAIFKLYKTTVKPEKKIKN